MRVFYHDGMKGRNMARWIKADGTEQEVHPENGSEFTNMELHTLVDGTITAYTLTESGQGESNMFVDDESTTKGKPINHVATELLHAHGAAPTRLKVLGDVVVAKRDEIGDE